MNKSELHLFFILRNRAYIHMHEALDAKCREESKQRHLLKAQWHSLQFFPDFSNKAFLLQLLNTAAGSKRQGLYCDHPPDSDALAFCPNCKKLPSLHLQCHHMVGQAAYVSSSCYCLGEEKRKVYQGIRTQLKAQGASQSSGGSGQTTVTCLFLGLALHHIFLLKVVH